MRRPLIMRIAMCNKIASIFSQVEREWTGSSWLQCFYIHFYSDLGRRPPCFVAYRKLIFLPFEWEELSLWDFRSATKYCSQDFTFQLEEILIWDSLLPSLSSITSPTFGLFKLDIYMIWDSWLKVIRFGSKGLKTSLLIPCSCLSWPLILSSPILPRFPRIVCRLQSILQIPYLWIRRGRFELLIKVTISTPRYVEGSSALVDTWVRFQYILCLEIDVRSWDFRQRYGEHQRADYAYKKNYASWNPLLKVKANQS